MPTVTLALAIVAAVGAVAAGVAVAYKLASEPGNSGRTPPAALTRETIQPASATDVKGDEPVTEEAAALPESIRYGFRYDPMKFVEEGTGLQAALVRKQVFGRPKEGDEEVIRAAVEGMLAEQTPNGALFEDENDVGATGVRFLRLLRFGCPPDRPEMKRAAAFMLTKEREEDGTFQLYGIFASCLAGAGDGDAIAASVRKLAAEFDGRFWEGCPYTPGIQLRALWAGREHADVDGALTKGLSWIAERTTPFGGIPGKFQWEIVECATQVEHPTCHDIIRKSVPLILRTQHADGGWGDDSLVVFQAMARFGLLDGLHDLPPSPADWRIARSIPARAESANGLVWHGDMLWTCLPEAGRIVALSPEEGRTIKSLAMENLRAVSEWDGELAVLQKEPYALCQIDAETGKVVRTVSGHAAYSAGLRALATRNSEKETCELWDAPVESLADAGEDVWCNAQFPQILVKLDANQRVLDWGENPFGEDAKGIAFDGENVWALDARYRRICMLEKAGGQPVPKATKPIRDDLRNYFNYGRGVYAAPGMADGHRQEWARILGLPSGERLGAMAQEAGKVGCTQETLGDAVLWLSAEGSTDALIMMVDKDDIRGMRRFMDLLAEAGSPLAFIIIRCDGYYDVLSMQPDWYIRHNNQPRDPAMKLRPPRPGVRDDLHDIDWKETWPAPEEVYAAPLADVIRAHAELAAKYGCTQSVDDGILIWRDEDGKLAAMLCVCEDTDLPLLRRLYARIEATDCPLTWLFLRLTHWEEPVFDILSMSRRHYMAHRNRIGDWHKAPRPFRREAEEDAAGSQPETF
ncbi:MAG: hypothetical protein ACYS9X_11300 [Planctomycetota bacterium]|jgi:hypothetical protein